MAKKKPYRIFVYLAVRFLAFIVAAISRRMALLMARQLGSLTYHLVGRQRDKINKNLALAYGRVWSDSQIRKTGSRVMGNMAETAVDVLRFSKFS